MSIYLTQRKVPHKVPKEYTFVTLVVSFVFFVFKKQFINLLKTRKHEKTKN
jgi:hypothetical protein